MSLATLKAKTAQKQNISKSNFSLNGGRRNISYIGKSYFNHPTNVYTSNDSSIIKNSAGNNHSLISNINKEEQVVKDFGGSVCGIGFGAPNSSEITMQKRAEKVECVAVGGQTSGEHIEEIKSRAVRKTSICP